MNNNITKLDSTRLIELTTRKLNLYFIAIFSLVLTGACTKGDNEPIPDPSPIAVSSVKLNKTSVTLSVGETVELTTTITPENATDKTVSWSSSNTNVATVTNGKVTAVAAGSATITAQAGNVKAECSVTVSPTEVTAITLNKTSLTLSAGETVELTATITPENATDKTVSWSSSNTSVATVTNGKVTAVAAGSATITARSNNGYSATCRIVVISKPDAGGSEGTGEEEW